MSSPNVAQPRAKAMPEQLNLNRRAPSNAGGGGDGAVEHTELLSPGPYSGPLSRGPPELKGASLAVHEYLYEREPIYRVVHELREKGWRSAEGDRHFSRLRTNADNANDAQQSRFYQMNKDIGNEMHLVARAFDIPTSLDVQALNLCMAPGGYTSALLQTHPTARIRGISLPAELGGHPMRLPHNEADPRVQVQFMDLTMLAEEFGVPVTAIPPTHPEAANFSAARLYDGKRFDLVLCDGQVLRTHIRPEYRQQQTREAVRLTTAQLILGMQRLKPGGTLIILLHKVEHWDSVVILSAFSKFATVSLFKPRKIHAQRSSFYLIAKDVQPQHLEAMKAVERWKGDWYWATFAGVEGTGAERGEVDKEDVRKVLQEFGERLSSLAIEVWRIQAEGLRRQHYVQRA